MTARLLLAALVGALAFQVLETRPTRLEIDASASPRRYAFLEVGWTRVGGGSQDAGGERLPLEAGRRAYTAVVPSWAEQVSFSPSSDGSTLAVFSIRARVLGLPFFAWHPEETLPGWHLSGGLTGRTGHGSLELRSAGGEPRAFCDSWSAARRARRELAAALSALLAVGVLLTLGAAGGARFPAQEPRASVWAAAGLAVLAAFAAGSWTRTRTWGPPRSARLGNILTLVDRDGRVISQETRPLRVRLDPYSFYRSAPGQAGPPYGIDENGRRRTTDGDPALRRAVVLGGSVGFGAMSPDWETIQSALNRRKAGYDWVNAAQPGWLSGQELSELVHRSARLEPALVVTITGWNDFFFSQLPHRRGESGYNWHVLRSVEDRLADQAAENKILQSSPAPRAEEMGRLATTEEGLREFELNLGMMDRLSRALGGRFLAVFQPVVTEKTASSADELAAQRTFRRKDLPEGLAPGYGRFVAGAKAYCSRQGIAFVDATTAPEIVRSTEALFVDEVHLTPRGNEIMADLIERTLASGPRTAAARAF